MTDQPPEARIGGLTREEWMEAPRAEVFHVLLDVAFSAAYMDLERKIATTLEKLDKAKARVREEAKWCNLNPKPPETRIGGKTRQEWVDAMFTNHIPEEQEFEYPLLVGAFSAAEYKAELAALIQERDVLNAENAKLREALRTLYEETAEYITINHLGDVHHNRSMQLARAALECSNE